MESFRSEHDALGDVQVPNSHLWGAQTQRSLENFRIGDHKIPKEIILALLSIKKVAAEVNCELSVLDSSRKDLIIQAIDALSPEDISSEFPLSVWQTGSGTQTNMNVNEVIANKANELAGQPLGTKSPIHPNDHVNKSQSSNDTFPTAMHLGFVKALSGKLIPALQKLYKALQEKEKEFYPIIKVGRTHLMDAVPIRLGQEFSGYAAQIKNSLEAVQNTLPHLYELAIGGTAVGTGINCPKGFKEKVCSKLQEMYSLPFRPAENPFEALAAHDAAVELSGALKRCACSFFKIANDIRLMASGPRCGLSELKLPENEPGSSIMPGKINPTQCEAMTQVACQVIGNDTAVTMAATQGHFELNVFKPLIAKCCLESINLLADVANNFVEKCLKGLQANKEHISKLLSESLMLVTALAKEIGYDAAAQVALLATHENLTLKEAALKLNVISEEKFNEVVDPSKMV